MAKAVSKKRLQGVSDEGNPTLTIDVGVHLNRLLKHLIAIGGRIETKLDALGVAILAATETIMAEIDDLNQKLDDQAAALSAFNETLQAGVAAIQTEIAQLAAAVGSATDLATLKAQVVAATDRVTSATNGISNASETLQAQIDALSADDPQTPAPATAKRKK